MNPRTNAAFHADGAARAWGAAFRCIAGAEPGMRQHAGRDETHMIFTGSEAPSVNGVYSFAPTPSAEQIESLASLAAQTAGEFPRPVPWCIQVRSRPGESVLRTAARYGLTQQSWEPLMVRDLSTPPGIPGAAPDLRVRAISGAESGRYATAMGAGFQAPTEIFAALATPAVLDAPAITAYVGEADGEVVATAMGIVTDGHVGVFNVSTVPAHRKRGYGRRLTEHVVAEGHRHGARTAYLRASDMGLSLYTSLGFEVAEHWTYLTAP
ncbi:GNAT family N-acetyltransferase [Streptomyces sp. NPDC088354]|uniref:GNAT family N-acetyltransferase n=1 Tax=unclassified Streptomyces TaxID=2593676 RepID=UPI0029A85394|nr:GNAT family N-acetyltransferase [Streptomyces sp. MI02-7b]MDX3070932.1 GNAT family N-acetyltransferase [Streptomyces sp. MI02-7b]